MDKYSLMVPNFIPVKEYFDPKHSDTCIGCGVSLAARLVGKALEKAFDQARSEAAEVRDDLKPVLDDLKSARKHLTHALRIDKALAKVGKQLEGKGKPRKKKKTAKKPAAGKTKKK